MKNLFFAVLFCALSLQSYAFNLGDRFIWNSRFWQNQFSFDIMAQDVLSAGVGFDITKHRDFDDKIYSFRLPFLISTSLVDFTFEPFLYPNTKNDAWAYGGKATIKALIRENEIDNTSSHGYLSAGFADQKANIARNGLTQNKENFKQFAFEGGLNFNYAGIYSFDISGNIYTYKEEVKNIDYFGGIMNQNEIADLGTIDYVLALPRFSVGGGILWLSTENNAKSFISYKYIGYEQDLTAHSVMLQTRIPVSDQVIITLVYNHLFETHKTNRDLFGLGLNYLF